MEENMFCIHFTIDKAKTPFSCVRRSFFISAHSVWLALESVIFSKLLSSGIVMTYTTGNFPNYSFWCVFGCFCVACKSTEGVGVSQFWLLHSLHSIFHATLLDVVRCCHKYFFALNLPSLSTAQPPRTPFSEKFIQLVYNNKSTRSWTRK